MRRTICLAGDLLPCTSCRFLISVVGGRQGQKRQWDGCYSRFATAIPVSPPSPLRVAASPKIRRRTLPDDFLSVAHLPILCLYLFLWPKKIFE
ncbi:hypothetical protein E3N88_03201 [Mikania micrantha]|uniref:Uncharacterized protein n=1 Tax=Mikania micrantha TaxID=192012 RepID=A0A5N6Q5W1_9ASTR|nr:hypothetical protein E3N88_03201 [Mikania micrantha]